MKYTRQFAALPIDVSELAACIGADVTGAAAVSGITANSRDVVPGDLFVAKPGAHVHGIRFAAQAVTSGAVAILTDAEGAASCEVDVPLVVVDDPGKVAGVLASVLVGDPASELETYAVTGTNGKTTTTYMIDSILDVLGMQPGIIGTVEVRLAGTQIPAKLTTPMPEELQSYLAFHSRGGGDSLAMEVSSHALIQGRVEPVRFDVAGFTNLTQDHLDFHKTMDEYFEAKATLFTAERSAAAVISVDDEWGKRLVERCALTLPVYAFTVNGELPDLPDSVIGWTVSGTTQAFVLRSSEGHEIATSTALPGDFNVANAALAVLMIAAAGHDLDSIRKAVRGGVNPTVPGRMELISAEPRVVVDFAHNTDALIKAIEALRPSTRGKLIVLTGAAGERDQGKRPHMGAAVVEHSDLVYITDDDPHDEDPAHIRRDVIAGTRGSDTPVIEIADRSQAIAEAIAAASCEDTILLAGRGHETIQEVAGVPIELDDRVEARRALRARGVTAMKEMP